jgi:histidinol-phosphatase (PHP family)
MIIADYHTHTFLCKHAQGTPEEYLRSAAEKGIKYLGISDHCPVPLGYDVNCRMDIKQFETYLRIVEKLKNNKYGIVILLGLEVDWVADRIEEITKFIGKYDFDYILGSIHYVEDFPFDHPDYIKCWDTQEKINHIWVKYAELLKDFINNIKIDIIGHIDLPKKFKMFPENKVEFIHKISEVISIAANKNIAIEINTAGKRKPVKEFYPSLEILQFIKKHDGIITFGSDSHAPNEIASEFEEAEQTARKAGFTDYMTISPDGTKKMISF